MCARIQPLYYRRFHQICLREFQCGEGCKLVCVQNLDVQVAGDRLLAQFEMLPPNVCVDWKV